ncbi:MAG TPA: 2-succinyl-5-enolpyruvyl-6-hydroxy-3-cyclohexene-1-carboxylic-acid synthase [Polyangiaceae bacterium]|nr:2-succinyl-5-enolpyruvyl-6-hydroxy-3-cyclohexene-1-carboxylic-acid synthase [Polyangiaceae bacterium]
MSDPQSQWAALLLESLVEAGVRDAIISPGSRSTPLVWAASHTRGLRCHSIIDERSAAFFALGQARLSGLPSVLICTSGTALANYFPAVIEARESGLPLLVVSADRPFELQHCGAHQTIDQTRLFGAYAHFHELGAPVAEREALLGLRRTARQAVSLSLEAPRGAVHLNFRARKPLEPGPGPAPPPLPGAAPRAALAPRRRAPVNRAELEPLLEALEGSLCPLLICGAAAVHDSPSAALVRRYAELSGSVVCPESVSQLRFTLGELGGSGLVCDTYDWLLASAALGAALAPDFALQLGSTPVSSSLERLIGAPERSLRYAICAASGWPDPLHKAAEVLHAHPSDLLEALCEALERRAVRPTRPRAALWRAAGGRARALIERHVREEFGEAAAVAELCARLPAGSVLALGNSLPPRLADRYAAASARGIRVCSQRGASGIEGAIAGAFGAASQAAAPVTLLLGDISFLHDIGSLWAAAPARTHAGSLAAPMVIVVLNNAGGRIFEQLPIAAHPGVPLGLWTTPHAMRLRAAAELYGLHHVEVAGAGQLGPALDAAYAAAEVCLIEVLVAPDGAASSQRRVSAQLEPLFAELAAEVAP